MAKKPNGQTILPIHDTLDNPESGKPGLPEPEPENDHESYEEDAGDEIAEDTKKEVTFTDKDQKDLLALEAKVTGGKRQAFESIREIRQRQLWRLSLDGEGKQLYSSFDGYCEDRWGHTRQWVTHGTNWLRIMEELESLGFPVPHLTVKAAQGLLIGRLENAGGLRAVLQEAQEDDVPLDHDHLREIVTRRADFNYRSKGGTDGETKPAAKTYAAYKQDVATAKQLGDSGSYDLVAAALKANGGQHGIGFVDQIVLLAHQRRKMPERDNLLANFTGVALEELVERLKGVALEIKAIEDKKTLLADRKKEIKSLQEGGIKKLKDEAKALETELVAAGVIKTKGKKPEPPQEDDGRGIPFPNQDDGDDEGEQEDDVSEVRTSLTDALAALDLAMERLWPDDSDELNNILLVTQECETKLAEINARVKELLADVKEPESIPIGDNA